MTIFFNSYSRDWSWLSNFHPALICVPVGGGGDNTPHGFPSAEHLYQFSKWDRRGVTGLVVSETIDKLFEMDAPEVRRWGLRIKLRPRWQDIKLRVMNQVLREKFAQNPKLADRLVATDDELLWHLSPWDQFWGGSETRVGLNRLGMLMMKQRDLLRRQ